MSTDERIALSFEEKPTEPYPEIRRGNTIYRETSPLGHWRWACNHHRSDGSLSAVDNGSWQPTPASECWVRWKMLEALKTCEILVWSDGRAAVSPCGADGLPSEPPELMSSLADAVEAAYIKAKGLNDAE